jgi:hypothetical protein
VKTTKSPHKTHDASKQGEKGKTKASWPSSKASQSPATESKRPNK